MAGMNATMAFAERRPKLLPRLRDVAGRWVALLAILAVWWALAHSGAFTPFMLPTPERVFLRIWNDGASGDLAINVGLTLYRTLTGFFIAAVLGVLFASTRSRWISPGRPAA